MRKKYKDFVGRKINRWTILSQTETKNIYLVKCDCGTFKKTILQAIVKETSKSCGCLNREIVTEHGYSSRYDLTKLRTYQVWSGIKQRCLNKENLNYFRYGGKGIGICSEWQNSFETFLKDMGEKPAKGYSIDRIDNQKGYFKENCRWATCKQQQQNISTNIMITFGGATRALSYWCDMFQIDHGTVLSRVLRNKKKYSYQEALTTPVTPRKKRNLLNHALNLKQ